MLHIEVDISLDTLKQDILEYLESSSFVIFRGRLGNFAGLPTIAWDSERYPDYRMYLETAKRIGAQMIVFSHCELESAQIDEALELLEEGDFTREERRNLERRLRELRSFEGSTCSIELAFNHHSCLYVYALRSDWYQEFVDIYDEIDARIPEEEDEEDDSMDGYFSKN